MTDPQTPHIPTDRRLTAKEAVFAIAFHDIEGGKLYDDLLGADNSDKLNNALLAAAGVIERAAAMGKVSVRGKEKVTHGSTDIEPIPDHEWDGLQLEIGAIKPPVVDSVYGATVDVRGSVYRQTRYVCLSFDPEQITELHNRHHRVDERREKRETENSFPINPATPEKPEGRDNDGADAMPIDVAIDENGNEAKPDSSKIYKTSPKGGRPTARDATTEIIAARHEAGDSHNEVAAEARAVKLEMLRKKSDRLPAARTIEKHINQYRDSLTKK